jgi:ABC-type Fe3+-hydroxamate transport system substrate-binding protein
MFEIVDQLNREVILNEYPPKRIISLVPSQTELLHDLGLNDEVIGITKFCVHPQSWFKNKTRVGGTKNVNIDKIISLKPDLILANKEENVKEQIEALENVAPVYISDINNFDDALDMIKSIGALTGKAVNASKLIENIRYSFSKLEMQNSKQKACYLIWRAPYMTIGGDTFINDMLNKCELQNIYGNENRYPQITLEDIKAKGAELILLSSEPFPFKEKHVEEIKTVLPHVRILMVDGEMFSWYGSRMLYAAQYFLELIDKINEPPQTLNIA